MGDFDLVETHKPHALKFHGRPVLDSIAVCSGKTTMNTVLRSALLGILASYTSLVVRAEDPIGNVRQLTDRISVELKLTPEAHFVFEGLSVSEAEARKQLRFTVANTTLENPPAIAGEFERGENRLLFHPRFPLSRSVTYRLHVAEALLDGKRLENRLLQFELPAATAEAAHVVAVYPTADVLPENVLKFYIHFSQPMSRGEAYERIHLFQGELKVDEAFLELGEELWDADQTRFTLFVHPGRIKRGVQPRELRGPPLSDGKHYSLRIDEAWQSASGQALSKGFEKQFDVTSAVHEQIDPVKWKLETPRAGTRDAVALDFANSLDQAMLARVLVVKFNDDSGVEGKVEIENHETRWAFVPDLPWRIGAHQIEVATNLEDLCGNNLAAPFEVKIQNGIAETPPSKIAIEFIVE